MSLDGACSPYRGAGHSGGVANSATGGASLGKVIAGITTSVDGYITGPDDGPGCGLGKGGERLHYWVFGGPWSYHAEPTEMSGEDKAWMDEAMSGLGAVVAGRWTYEAADHWATR